MTDDEIIEYMKSKVESIIREKSELTYTESKSGTIKREIVNEIIKELSKVVDHEN